MFKFYYSSLIAFKKCVLSYVVFAALLSLIIVPPGFAVTNTENYAICTLNPEFKSLSTSKARLLFRGRVKTLNGQLVELADWSNEHKVRNEFYKVLLGKNSAQMNAHWASISFSGKARPPKQILEDSTHALVNWLSEKPNRIGYAPLSSLPKDVIILYVVQGDKYQ